MLAVPPRLKVRRPSPTTILYTVSTRPPPSLGLSVALAGIVVLRLLAVAAVFVLLHTKWTLDETIMAYGPDQHENTSNIATTFDGAPLLPTEILDGLASAVASNTSALTSTFSTSTAASSAATTPAADSTTAQQGAPDPPAAAAASSAPHGFSGATALYASRLQPPLAGLVVLMPWPAVLLFCASLLYLALRRLHTRESLLVLRGLGIQTSTSDTFISVPTALSALALPPYWLVQAATLGVYFLAVGLGLADDGRGSALPPPEWDWGWADMGKDDDTTRFIPTEKIRDVLVTETFIFFSVRYILVIVVEGEDDLVVVFPRLRPSRRVVEKVWRGVSKCLFEGPGLVGSSAQNADPRRSHDANSRRATGTGVSL